MGDRDKRSWVIRRAVYVAGFAAGLIVVALGRGTIAEVEGWAPMIEQAATLAAALASGFAAIKTGPDSDNTRPVVPAAELAEAVDVLVPRLAVAPELVDGVTARLDHLAERAERAERAAPAAAPSPLAELRAAIEKRGGG